MNWIEVLAAGLGGAAGGAVGGLAVELVRNRAVGDKVRQAVRVVPIVLGGMLGAQLLGPMATEYWADAQARTPAQKFERVLQRTAMKSPEVKAWSATLQARGMTAESAAAEGRGLGARGIARLTDEDLGVRTRILGKGMALVSPATCASVARGSGGREELAKILDSVGESDALELAGIATRSMLAEIRQAPGARPATSEAEARSLLLRIAGISGPDAVGKVVRMFETGASDAEVCAGALVLYGAFPAFEPAAQPRLAMLIAGL
jgi:hypothetical protein